MDALQAATKTRSRFPIRTPTAPTPLPDDSEAAEAPDDSAPYVMGAGLTTLDAIWSGDPEQEPMFRAGGTCGNVLTILAAMGWMAYPVAQLGRDPAGDRLRRDWERWGVRLDFTSFDSEAATPVIFQRLDGGPDPIFFRACPRCGTIPPWHRPISEETVITLARDRRMPRLSAFFFDQPTASAVALARVCAEQGALVMFEPPIAQPLTLVKEAVEIAHMVKWSQQDLGGVVQMEAWTKSKLLSIHTLGGLGLRWRRGPARGDVEAPGWRTSAASPASVVNDAAGCGDWCSAALLHRLGRLGPTGLGNATDDAIETAIRDAQAWASWNCRFFGARGGMVPPFVPLAPRDEPRIRPSTSLCPFCLQAPATAGVAEVLGDKASQ